jgi:uncharacterized protein YkwD
VRKLGVAVAAIAVGGGAVAQASPAAGERAVAWSAYTASPRPLAPEGDARTQDAAAEFLARCGRGEAGLASVAEQLVANRLAGAPHLDLDALTFELRAAGEPHVWPHAWVITGRPLDRAATLAKLDEWGTTFHDGGSRRCGIARGTAPDGTEVAAAVAVDALADLAPLPTRARVGTWLTVDASLLVPVRSPRVVVQGHGSDPRSIPSWTDTVAGVVHVRARFMPDRPGPLTVQVMADAGTGPRPLIEARVFADVEPPMRFDAVAAPGEDATLAQGTEADRLLAMLSSLRALEHLAPLSRDRRLDDVALAHAREMLAAKTVGHDIGDGDPVERVGRTGEGAHLVGENVAHAASVRLAHRALYESPSHRENLLRGEFDRVGAAVVSDTDGSVWVAEVFAGGR